MSLRKRSRNVAGTTEQQALIKLHLYGGTFTERSRPRILYGWMENTIYCAGKQEIIGQLEDV
jgi:hypothetical protein